MVFLSASVVAVLVFLADNNRRIPTDESGTCVVSRNGQGEGSREEELQIQIGDVKEQITVEIGEQEYRKEELDAVFAAAGEKLESLILGDNQSLDEVRSDLKLVTQIPGTGIEVSWELDNYEVMNLQGTIQEENLTDSGVIVQLKALLLYGTEKYQHIFYAHVYPPYLSQTEKILQKVENEIERLDTETKESEYMPLPTSVDEEPVIWRYRKNFRAAAILLLGAALAIFIYVSEQQKQKEEKKKRNAQMMLDYPQLVSKLTLFLGAGMTVRKAWYRIAEEYELQKKDTGQRVVYEEMLYTVHEMQDGAFEGECYERFGERCGLSIYRKFGTLLSQNLKKGTKGLNLLLKQEALNAFEERKTLAKRLGEEAGTKLLIPMFLMLAVVLIIVVIPALLSIQV